MIAKPKQGFRIIQDGDFIERGQLFVTFYPGSAKIYRVYISEKNHRFVEDLSSEDLFTTGQYWDDMFKKWYIDKHFSLLGSEQFRLDTFDWEANGIPRPKFIDLGSHVNFDHDPEMKKLLRWYLSFDNGLKPNG